jgi:hypothetical protein
MASEGPGVGAIVGAGMVLLVVVVLASVAIKQAPPTAPQPPPPAPTAPPTPTPAATPTATPAAAGPMRFNDPENTKRYTTEHKNLEAIQAAIPDIALKGETVAADVQKKCDAAAANLTMLGAEPDKSVRAFIETYKRACEYEAVGATLDMLVAKIEASRARKPGARPAECATGETYAKAVASHHYEDDPAMKDRLGRFARGCL